MPPKKQRTPALRDRVLDAALVVLADDGVAGFTTRRVAEQASTSVPALYELFGDKGGLVRSLFFEGFRRLGRELAAVGETDDPRADIERLVSAFRDFAARNRHLTQLMFSRPFVDFDPGADEGAAGATVRDRIVASVQRAVDAGVIVGNPTDIAHVIVAVAHGLSVQEAAGWLGTSPTSRNRRWALATRSVLDGLAPVR
jgi:AcrR family transcriptional regulator